MANRPYMAQFFAQGTTTVEVKSGYGLTTADEIKTLKAIAQLQVSFNIRGWSLQHHDLSSTYHTGGIQRSSHYCPHLHGCSCGTCGV